MSKELLNPAGLSTPTGYTHVVMISSSKLAYISGQVSLATGPHQERQKDNPTPSSDNA
jgi:hypothetical protein